ncbi:hypothetical protein PGQ11_001558 [Apiospora arundinis]|uniref:Uncharacterized protein n=1 Tax=Apiospora arundinis TaxID=335852 RepID=A0ABR2JNA7_9PEZI
MAGPSRSYRRRFRALVTPALYHTVTVCKQGGPYQFEAFLCTVLSSPDDIAPLDPLVLAWETVVVRSFDERDDGNEYWGQYFVVLAALLLPRLTTLYCADFNGAGSPDGLATLMGIADRLAPEPGSVAPFWKELTDIKLNGGFSKYPLGPVPIACFATLWPSIKSIYSAGYANCGEGLLPVFDSLAPASSSLEALELGPWSQPNHQNLDAMLKAPRALKLFRYDMGNPWTYFPLRTDVLQQSLEYQKHALQEVSIIHRHCRFSPDEEFELMSFAALSSLRVLEISLRCVFAKCYVCFDEGLDRLHARRADGCAHRLLAEILSASIETVRFAQCGGQADARLLDSALLRMLEVRDERIPRLRAIEVHVDQDVEWKAVVDAGHFLGNSVRTAEAAGISFEVVSGSNLTTVNLNRRESELVEDARWGD